MASVHLIYSCGNNSSSESWVRRETQNLIQRQLSATWNEVFATEIE
jgi:hypothetical protein